MLVLAMVLGACGDDGGDAIDSGVGSDATIDMAVDAAPANAEGQVFIGETPLTSIVVAMFLSGPLLDGTGIAGPCQSGDTTPASSLDAGTISITGTTEPLTLVQEEPGDVYVAPESPTDVFVPGATLTVTTTGGQVPAFTATVTAPQPLTITTPTTYSRAAPPTFTWGAGTGSSELWILLQSATTAAPGGILCRVPDTGSYTMTTAALALLPAGVTQVTAIVYRIVETKVQAGAWSVALRAADGAANRPRTPTVARDNIDVTVELRFASLLVDEVRPRAVAPRERRQLVVAHREQLAADDGEVVLEVARISRADRAVEDRLLLRPEADLDGSVLLADVDGLRGRCARGDPAHRTDHTGLSTVYDPIT